MKKFKGRHTQVSHKYLLYRKNSDKAWMFIRLSSSIRLCCRQFSPLLFSEEESKYFNEVGCTTRRKKHRKISWRGWYTRISKARNISWSQKRMIFKETIWRNKLKKTYTLNSPGTQLPLPWTVLYIWTPSAPKLL